MLLPAWRERGRRRWRVRKMLLPESPTRFWVVPASSPPRARRTSRKCTVHLDNLMLLKHITSDVNGIIIKKRIEGLRYRVSCLPHVRSDTKEYIIHGETRKEEGPVLEKHLQGDIMTFGVHFYSGYTHEPKRGEGVDSLQRSVRLLNVREAH
ncbi:hypothetical protein Naga_100185g1 [Nannochloropsis gaditana]|uniref:Uncharacterized protein n=1 Tax=Nannochloropsis gaditana TaxID=72520 RepID=W7TV26_9STRA|nr:hypothetical protein Naga_100185g1 [Nannochloropsis gaditana]